MALQIPEKVDQQLGPVLGQALESVKEAQEVSVLDKEGVAAQLLSLDLDLQQVQVLALVLE